MSNESTKIEVWFCCLTLAVLPLIFWRGVIESFDLVKATALWVLALPLLPLSVSRLISTGSIKKCWPQISIVAALTLSLIVATSVSFNRWRSIYGQDFRFTGLITLIACLGIFLCLATSSFSEVSIPSMLTLSLVLIPVVLYGVLQEAGRDPFDWQITSFSGAAFSTIGNPNTASGFVAITSLVSLYSSAVQRNTWLKLVCSFAAFAGSASLPLFASSQGQLAVFFAGLVLLFGALFGRLSFPQRRVAIVGSVLFCLSLVQPRSVTWVLLIGCVGAILSWSPFNLPSSFRKPLLGAARYTKQASLFLSLLTVFGLLLFRESFQNSLTDGLTGGFSERRFFYESALRTFKSHPYFGTGLETFGEYFTNFRPAEHAIRLEGSRTNSVHSVPLAMFQSGGLLLGLTFVVFLAVTTVMALRTVFRAGRELPQFALLAVWVACVFQMLVSVEHVVLFATYFVIAGAIWSLYLEGEIQHRTSRGRRLSVKGSYLSFRQLMISGTCIALSILLLTSPFRASMKYLDGEKFSIQGNGELALDSFERASELVGWNGQYRSALVEVQYQLGFLDRAAENALKSAEDSRFSSANSLGLAQVLAEAGRFEDAISVIVGTTRNDPKAPQLRAGAEALLQAISRYLLDIGDEGGRRLVDQASEELSEL